MITKKINIPREEGDEEGRGDRNVQKGRTNKREDYYIRREEIFFLVVLFFLVRLLCLPPRRLLISFRPCFVCCVVGSVVVPNPSLRIGIFVSFRPALESGKSTSKSRPHSSSHRRYQTRHSSWARRITLLIDVWQKNSYPSSTTWWALQIRSRSWRFKNWSTTS